MVTPAGAEGTEWVTRPPTGGHVWEGGAAGPGVTGCHGASPLWLLLAGLAAHPQPGCGAGEG